MTKTSTIRSWPAMVFAGVCIAGTGYVLFEDVVRGGVINVGHVTGVIALIVTIAAGHMMWSALRQRPIAALGLALLFTAGTGYVVITSAGRTAHVMAERQLAAEDLNKRYLKATRDFEEAKRAWSDAAAEAAKECASGKKTKCEGRQLSADKAESHMHVLQVRADRLKPVHTASDYLHAAKGLATITGGSEKALEAKLALLIPFVLVMICEIGSIVFGNLAIERPVTRRAHTFEVPKDPKELEEAKQFFFLKPEAVRELKSRGMKHHEIAALFEVNQGRISELLTGRRTELRVLN